MIYYIVVYRMVDGSIVVLVFVTCIVATYFVYSLKSLIRKGVSYTNRGELVDCIFCRIGRCDPKESAKIIFQDPKYIFFKSLYGATDSHLLIIPKTHVQNITSFNGIDSAHLIEEMILFADFSLAKLNPAITNRRYCFHIPPFNGIDHLHLHAIGNSHKMSLVSRLEFMPNTLWSCDAKDLISKLCKEK